MGIDGRGESRRWRDVTEIVLGLRLGQLEGSSVSPGGSWDLGQVTSLLSLLCNVRSGIINLLREVLSNVNIL